MVSLFLGSLLNCGPLATTMPCFGRVAERSNAPDSKSGIRLYRIVGSNPTPSATDSTAAFSSERCGKSEPRRILPSGPFFMLENRIPTGSKLVSEQSGQPPWPSSPSTFDHRISPQVWHKYHPSVHQSEVPVVGRPQNPAAP